MKKKFLSLFLVLIVFCSVSVSAVYSRASSRINGAEASLSELRPGKLVITLSIRTCYIVDTLGADNIVMQRYNGSRWVNEHTITSKEDPDLLEYNETAYDIDISYVPEFPDSTYRAIVTFYAEDRDGTSTKKITTNCI